MGGKRKNAGRKRVVPLDDLYAKFGVCEEAIVRENKVVAPSDTIWDDIFEHFEKKSSKKAIYNDALRWTPTNKKLKT